MDQAEKGPKEREISWSLKIAMQERSKGWLTKDGEGKLASRKRRYFVLDYNEHRLNYYVNEEEKKLCGFIDLDKACFVNRKPEEDSFEIVTKDRIYQLQAGEKLECSQWVTTLSKIIAFYADFETLKKRFPIGFLFYFNNKGILEPFLDLSLVPVADCIQYIHEGAAIVKSILLNSYERATPNEVVALMWLLYAKCGVFGELFVGGMLRVDDPAGKIFDYISSAKRVYNRLSSHYPERLSESKQFGGHFGLDILVEPGAYKLPADKHTILFFRLGDDTTAIKLESAGVPPIWKKEFMTLEGTKSFFQHSTGFVSGRFEDKGQVQNMKRKEHVPNWALDCFSALLSSPTSATSPFQLIPCDLEKREQLLLRAREQGITWMLATLDAMILARPTTPRDDSGASAGNKSPRLEKQSSGDTRGSRNPKRSTKEFSTEKSFATEMSSMDERKDGSNDKRREEKWLNLHREKKETIVAANIDVAIRNDVDGMPSQSAQRGSGGWNRQLNIGNITPSSSVVISPRLASPRGSSQRPKELIEENCVLPVHALRIASPRGSSQKPEPISMNNHSVADVVEVEHEKLDKTETIVDDVCLELRVESTESVLEGCHGAGLASCASPIVPESVPIVSEAYLNSNERKVSENTRKRRVGHTINNTPAEVASSDIVSERTVESVEPIRSPIEVVSPVCHPMIIEKPDSVDVAFKVAKFSTHRSSPRASEKTLPRKVSNKISKITPVNAQAIVSPTDSVIVRPRAERSTLPERVGFERPVSIEVKLDELTPLKLVEAGNEKDQELLQQYRKLLAVVELDRSRGYKGERKGWEVCLPSVVCWSELPELKRLNYESSESFESKI